MAVEEIKSNLVKDRFDPNTKSPDPLEARGRPIYATGSVANAVDGSSGSTYHLCDLPSNCLMLPDTFFDVENWGYAQVVIGTLTDTDALVDQTKVTENIVTPIAQGDANHGKRLWEILGLAEDPGGMISLYGHSEAGATGAGSMPFQVAYLFN